MKFFFFRLPAKYFVSFFVFLLLIFVFSKGVFAQIFDEITARVRPAICGDNKAEGDEDCDNNNLNHKDCADLGYAGGDLSCTSACEYDLTLCISPTPTLTPTPTASATSAPNANTTNESTSTTTDENENKNKEQKQERKNIFDLILFPVPENVLIFDTNQDEKITNADMFDSVQTWVDSWTTSKDIVVYDSQAEKPVLLKPMSCDINNDGICNLVDFSILLYYIER